jgi:hypothetical protein
MSVRSFLRGRSPAMLATIAWLAFMAVLGLIFLAVWGVTGDWRVAYRAATRTGIWFMLLILVGGVAAVILHMSKGLRRRDGV